MILKKLIRISSYLFSCVDYDLSEEETFHNSRTEQRTRFRKWKDTVVDEHLREGFLLDKKNWLLLKNISTDFHGLDIAWATTFDT